MSEYTTADAAQALGVSIRTFQRLCRDQGVEASGERRTGRVRVKLYSTAAVEYLRARHDGATDGRPGDDTTRQAVTVRSEGENMAALIARLVTDGQDMAYRLAMAETERDALQAENESLRQQLDTARQRKRFWWW